MPRLGAPFPQRNASFGRRGPGPKLGRARSGVCPRLRRSAVEMPVDAERALVALGEAAGEFGRGFTDGIDASSASLGGAQPPDSGGAAGTPDGAPRAEVAHEPPSRARPRR